MQPEISIRSDTHETIKTGHRRSLSDQAAQAKNYFTANESVIQQMDQSNLKNMKSKLGFSYMPSNLPIIIKDRTYIDRKDTMNAFLRQKDFNHMLGIPENLTMKASSIPKQVSIEHIQNVSKVNKDKMVRISNQKRGVMFTNELWSNKYYVEMIKNTGMRKTFQKLKLKDGLQTIEQRYQQLDHLFKKKRKDDSHEKEISHLLSKFQNETAREHNLLQTENDTLKTDSTQLRLYDVAEEPWVELKPEKPALKIIPSSPTGPNNGSLIASPRLFQTSRPSNYKVSVNALGNLLTETQLGSTSTSFFSKGRIQRIGSRNLSVPTVNSDAEISNEQENKLYPKQLSHRSSMSNFQTNHKTDSLFVSPRSPGLGMNSTNNFTPSEHLVLPKNVSQKRINVHVNRTSSSFFNHENAMDAGHITIANQMKNSFNMNSHVSPINDEFLEFEKLIGDCNDASEGNHNLLGYVSKQISKRRMESIKKKEAQLTEEATSDVLNSLKKRKAKHYFLSKK